METSFTAPTPRRLRSCAPIQYLWCCAFRISLSQCSLLSLWDGLWASKDSGSIHNDKANFSLRTFSCTAFIASESDYLLTCVWLHLLNTLLQSRDTRVWMCQPQRLFRWISDIKFNNELVCVIAPCSDVLLGGTWVAESMNNLEIALVFFSFY